jgi:hypothetical protein
VDNLRADDLPIKRGTAGEGLVRTTSTSRRTTPTPAAAVAEHHFHRPTVIPLPSRAPADAATWEQPLKDSHARSLRPRRLQPDTRNVAQSGLQLCPTACPTGPELPMAKPKSAGIIIRVSGVRVSLRHQRQPSAAPQLDPCEGRRANALAYLVQLDSERPFERVAANRRFRCDAEVSTRAPARRPL